MLLLLALLEMAANHSILSNEALEIKSLDTLLLQMQSLWCLTQQRMRVIQPELPDLLVISLEYPDLQ